MDLAPDSEFFRRWFSRFFLVVASVVAFPALSFAAHKHRKFHLDLFAEGGGSLYQGSQIATSFVTETTPTGTITSLFVTKGAANSSGRLFVGGDLWFTRHDAVEMSYSYARADVSSTTTQLSGSPSPAPFGFASSIGGHFLAFDYLRSFTLSRNWSLLLDAGVGAVWWRALSDTNRCFSANIGAGVSYRLTPHWSLRADYRDYMERFPFSGGAMLHNHAPTIGLVYRF